MGGKEGGRERDEPDQAELVVRVGVETKLLLERRDLVLHVRRVCVCVCGVCRLIKGALEIEKRSALLHMWRV